MEHTDTLRPLILAVLSCSIKWRCAREISDEETMLMFCTKTKPDNRLLLTAFCRCQLFSFPLCIISFK
jgi:hypothetical protein